MSWEILQADCIEAMRQMDEASVDAIVTDPPYGLEFMGKEWDALGKGWNDRTEASETGQDKGDFSWFGGNVRPRYGTDSRAMQEWHHAWATEALRVLKPGGHLLAFGGTRTYHRLACAIEDAGFEIRDCLAWMYGSGFPKSLDVSKAIDKAAGAEREVVGERVTAKGDGGEGHDFLTEGSRSAVIDLTAPATPEAAQWEGWGTALKPAHEPIVLARKPLTGTVAANCLEHGTGALNIDGCRIEGGARPLREPKGEDGNLYGAGLEGGLAVGETTAGRWPANLLLGHSPDCGFSSGQLLRLEAWENGESLCDSCAEDAVGSPRLTAPATRESSAPSLAEPTTNGRDGTPPDATDRTATGFSSGLSQEGLSESQSDATSLSTDESGGSITDAKSPRATSSTTSTATDSTTELRTCNSCAAPTTNPSTARGDQCVPECPIAMLDEQSGERSSGYMKPTHTDAERSVYGQNAEGGYTTMETYGDSGGASRFMYVAKASRSERNAGLDSKMALCQCPRPQVDIPPRRDTDAVTEEDESGSFTTGSGSRSGDQSPKASKSTTGTAIRQTTESRTSNSSRRPSTSESTPRTTDESGTDGNGAAQSAVSGSQPTPNTSTSQSRDGSSTDVADRATSPESSATNSGARCASCGGVIQGALRNSHPT